MPPKKKKAEEESKGPLSFEELMTDAALNGGLVQTSYAAVDRIDTGSISVNKAFGGGVPLGLTTHIAGPTGSGKTTLGVQIGTSAVKAGLRVAVINQEYRWNPMMAYKSGMGTPGKDYLLFSFPDGESALNCIVRLARNDINLFIFDSVAAAASKQEAKSEEIGEGGAYGAMAKMWSEFFRVHSSTIANNNAALVLFNQFRVDMRPVAFGGGGNSRPGGKALDFYPAIAADMRKIGREDKIMVHAENKDLAKLMSDEKDKNGNPLVPIGVTIEGKTWKNVTATNFQTFSVEILFQNGGAHLNWPKEVAEWGKALGVFRNKDGNPLGSNGHWYLDGIKVGETMDGVIAWLEDPVNVQQVIGVRARIKEVLADYE